MCDLKGLLLGFRIGAPPAAHRTPFEENGRADAGPVMYGVTIDVENGAPEVRIHGSANLVGRTGKDFILNVLAQHDKIIAVSGHPDQQGAVIIWSLLGLEKGFL